ncbi:TonB-dependent receptor [Polyangium sp. 15x6]|uniref:TonB-dependent receptor n=1 Tax=Polyangium sp. 15x6 TaxID=3042687 RepID=UPI00249C5E2C|nr:TonB-dependent receptor [Polyangium sp. 15x6]MDI3282281.1 TonB-dependent receptor [Polyangium sp. 15x6]
MVFPLRIPLAASLVGVFLAIPPAHAEEPLPSGLGEGSATRWGESLDPSGLRLLPLSSPEQRGGPARSFENLALLLPGTLADRYGVSFVGASSPENTFFVDGIRVGHPTYGILQMPLSMEFVERADITVIGADPAFGRGGGLYDVTTKSGGNQWHASTWGGLAPGALEGERVPKVFEGTVIHTDPRLDGVRDLGGSVGGPIVKDRLFFFAGGSLARRRYRLERSLRSLSWGTELDEFGGLSLVPEIDPETGAQKTTLLPNSQSTQFAQGDIGQWIGKLTYRPSKTREISLSVFGSFAGSGGGAVYPFDLASEGVGVDNLNGEHAALGRRETALTNAVVLRGTSVFARGNARLDAALGWVRSENETRAADGSGVDDIGREGTLAHVPRMLWRRGGAVGPHPFTHFEDLTTPALVACAPTGQSTDLILNCPASSYAMGGPGLLSRSTADRIEGRAVVSLRARGLGEHRIRAGIDFEVATLAYVRGYSGAVLLREDVNGGFVQNDRFGYLRGPDDPVVFDTVSTRVTSYAAGGFVADTWHIVPGLVAEASLRYDAQVLGGGTLALPFMLAPRAAISWDPTKTGRARVFATYGMRYQAVPLDVAARGISRESKVTSIHTMGGRCDVNEPEDAYGGCPADTAILFQTSAEPSSLSDPQTSQASIDPEIEGPAYHQWVVGGDVVGPLGVRLGVVYVHDQLIRTIEDTTFTTSGGLIGNPGGGAWAFMTSAERVYDAFSISLMRPFAGGFVGVASYTLSSLRGNYEGFFLSRTGQLDPNMTRAFDTPELDANGTGPLPGDHTHSIKLYAGKEVVLPAGVILEAGAGYTALSGSPYSALGAHPWFGASEVYLLPRGSVGLTPWLHRIDARFGVSALLGKGLRLGANVEVYNLADSRTPTAFEENFTYDAVLPIEGGVRESIPAGIKKNPRYEKPVAFQAPRQVRFGLRVDY